VRPGNRLPGRRRAIRRLRLRSVRQLCGRKPWQSGRCRNRWACRGRSAQRLPQAHGPRVEVNTPLHGTIRSAVGTDYLSLLHDARTTLFLRRSPVQYRTVKSQSSCWGERQKNLPVVARATSSSFAAGSHRCGNASIAACLAEKYRSAIRRTTAANQAAFITEAATGSRAKMCSARYALPGLIHPIHGASCRLGLRACPKTS
jgi:hypothetical protein